MTLFGEETKLFYDGTQVEGVYEISGADSSVAEIERTPLGADSKQFRPSCQVESGTVSFAFYYDPQDATHVAIRGQLASTPTTTPYKIEYSDGTTHEFDAFPTSIAMSGQELESEVACEVELRITGAIVETVPAP